jgi:ABC-type Na+ transport system ATPase subunit NatA
MHAMVIETSGLTRYRNGVPAVNDLGMSRRIEDLFDRIDPGPTAHRRFGTYSTGMKQHLGRKEEST